MTSRSSRYTFWYVMISRSSTASPQPSRLYNHPKISSVLFKAFIDYSLVTKICECGPSFRMKLRRNFAVNLRRIRSERNLSQDNFAAFCHILLQYTRDGFALLLCQRNGTRRCFAESCSLKAVVIVYNNWMLSKLSSPQSGTLGELLAVAKLNSLGYSAYISPEGAPGHDLMVVVDGKARSVEVKTRQFLKRPSEITRWPVDMNAKGDAEFFIFIELDLQNFTPTFYLLTNAQARETHKDYKGGGNCTPPQVRRLVSANDFSALNFD